MNGVKEIIYEIIHDEILRDVIVLYLWSFSESIIWPIPIAFILAAYTIANPGNWWLYGITVTIGSVSGATIAYYLGKIFKDIILTSKSLELFRKLIGIDQQKFKQVQDMYDKYGGYAIILAAISPIPYKLVTWVSGMMEYNMKWFLILSVVGRGVTFLFMALVFSMFGELANEVLKPLKDLGWIVVLAIIIGYLIYKFYKK
ncbi:MAG: VTT domain-containing protein [Candidatus Anstonellales archaeon]